jgi:hypothetical protein
MSAMQYHRCIFADYRRRASDALAVLGAMFALAALGAAAPAQTYTVLHGFAEYPTDGVSASAGLVRDSAANLWAQPWKAGDRTTG